MERGLTVVAISGILLCIALAIGIAVLVANSNSCDVNNNGAAEALAGSKLDKSTPTVIRGPDSVCTTPACIHAASKVLNNMDEDVEPCDDFYKFACGGFLKNTLIPDDKVSVNSFSVISDKVQEQLRISIEEPSYPMEPKPFKLAKNLYKACMNKTAIEAQGLTPLLNILRKLGGWPVLDGDMWNEESFDWIESVYKFRDSGYSVDYFLDFSIGVDLKNSTKRVIDLDQASLGLSREYLSKGLDDKIVKAYYNYMVDIAVILGAKRELAAKQLLSSLKFEIQLANY